MAHAVRIVISLAFLIQAQASSRLHVVNNSDDPVRVLLAVGPGARESDWSDIRLEPGKQATFTVREKTNYMFRIYRYKGPVVLDMGFDNYSFDPPNDKRAPYEGTLELDHWATWDASNPARKVKRVFDPPQKAKLPFQWKPGEITLYIAQQKDEPEME